VREALGEALQGQLAVARLRAGVLRGRRRARAQTRGDPGLLGLESVCEAATSNDASTREAVTLAC